MTVAANPAPEIQDLYDRLPYPSSDPDVIAQAPLMIPLREWFNVTVRPEKPVLGPGARVLIAGCGSGAESFALNRATPGMEIVGIDFSENSVKIAESLAWKSRMPNLSFDWGDLTDPNLPDHLGQFDFISCHGVLAYVPDLEAAVKTLSRLCRPDGCLYLGVNGPGHSSVRFRRAMLSFGLDPLRFEDTPAVRQKLRALQHLVQGTVSSTGLPVHELWAGYLSGDIFGPLIHNLPLSSWLELASANGLHLAGTMCGLETMTRLQNVEDYSLFLPFNRPQIALLDDTLHSRSFHQIILSPAPPLSPPWTDPAALDAWRPLLRFSQPAALPKKPENQTWDQTVEIQFQYPRPAAVDRGAFPWSMVELLRQSDGSKSLSTIAKKLKRPVDNLLLNKLYHQMQINLLPPVGKK